MFKLRRVSAAVASTLLLLVWPAFPQTSNGWPFAGNDLNNSHWATAETLLNNGNVGGLTVLWKFTTQNDVSATPSVDVSGSYVYFPDWSGNLYKLNAATGATVWTHKMTDFGLSPSVITRTTPTLSGSLVLIGASAPLASPNPTGSFLLALNASDGSLVWSTPLDPNLNSVSTASPIVYNGIAYVGVSSGEERLSNPTFRGSLVAISLGNGQILWQTYFVPSGYSGAPVWSSTPVIDTARSQIYVTTGNNYLVPPSVQACEQAAYGNQKAIAACQLSNNYEDAIVALDLATGNVKWGRRCSAEDSWIVACDVNGSACPDPAGLDLDFGAGANLITASIGGVPTPLVGAGQKSGVYWALSPVNGTTLWSTPVGPGGKLGGMEWGTASDNQRIYVAISNAGQRAYTLQPSGTSWSGASWAALNPATGAILWQVPDPGSSTVHAGAHALALGPLTVANGVVYAASMSGFMYALDAATGATLWSFQAPGSVNAAPAVVNGIVYWGTGYHNFPVGNPAGTASNTFYAFALPPAPPGPVMLACAAATGQVGVPYASSLTASGGVPPYTFSITAGWLPPGLSLNSSTGAISGTPPGTGNFSYSALVADSTGTPAGTATQACGVVVGAPATSTALTVTPNPVRLAQAVTLMAQVSPVPDSGKVTFYDGSAVLGSAVVTAGSATVTATLFAAGAHELRATYSGSASYSGSSSSATLLMVQALPSSTLLTAVPYQANGPGTSVAAGDFNGDGITDFLVANGGLSVWLGNGDGTFQEPVSTLSTGIALATGDFNGDGFLDVAAVDANGVTILLGNGDGTFATGASYAVTGGPNALTVADFNGDGLADLAVTNANGVSVLIGNSDGSFQAAVNYSAGAGPAAVAAGDLTGSGKAGLVVANAADGTVSVLAGNGNGTFQTAASYTVGANPQAVAVTDLNGDGRVDLVVTNNAANSVSVLLGNGDGTFQGAVSYATGSNPQALAAGDVNGDGQIDVVTANAADGTVSVLLGNGNGTLQAPANFQAGGGPVSVALADFNGDGRADVVAAGGSGSTATVLLGGQAATSVGLSASLNPSTLGQGVTWTATVTPVAPYFGVPTGTVTFADGGTALSGGTTGLSGGQAAYTISTLAAGTHAITAPYGGDAAFLAGNSAVLTQTVNPGPQTISFGTLANQVFGIAPFQVNATASSGLPVSFASTTASVCTVSGATVTVVGVGVCTISATQSGNASYAAAPPVNRSFAVARGSQTIVFGALSNQVFGSAPFTLSATASSGLPAGFNSQTSKICVVNGKTVTMIVAGTCTIQATEGGSSNWLAAAPVSQSFQITPASQTINFAALTNQTLGSAPFQLSATASSGLAVNFASATTPVCTVSGTTVTLVATGVCTIHATQPGNVDYTAAPAVNHSFQVTRGTT